MINYTTHEVAASCRDAITHIFQTDGQGEIALEATRLLAKLLKEGQKFQNSQSLNQIRPDALRTFLSLPLRVHEDEAQAAKLAASAKTKKRKRDTNRDGPKELADDSKGLEDDKQEGEATVDKILLARSQADTLHLVTLTYFRFKTKILLKNLNGIRTKPSRLRDDVLLSKMISER